jgi:AraC-like DNA-binding protein
VGRAIISIIVDLYLNDFSFGVRYFYFSVIICTIFYVKLLITPEILFGYNFFSEKVAQQQILELNLKHIWLLSQNIKINNIQDAELNKKISRNLRQYIKDIEEASFEKKIFRNEVLQIGVLANQIGIPKSHLVYIFKYHCKKSFIEFKKVVRISDAIALIESNYLVNNTLESLAKKTGFSSYNTFFTSFREITGVTPRIFQQVFSKKILKQTVMS